MAGQRRELANVLERAQILAEDHRITIDDLPESFVDAHVAVGSPARGDPRHLRTVERLHVRESCSRKKATRCRPPGRWGSAGDALSAARETQDSRETRNEAGIGGEPRVVNGSASDPRDP